MSDAPGYSPAMTAWLLLDDGGGSFGPLTDLRSFAEVRTGAMTAIERFGARLGPSLGTIVGGDLAALAAERGIAAPSPASVAQAKGCEVWNARLRGELPKDRPARGEAWTTAEGELLAASLEGADATELLERRQLPDRVRRIVRGDLHLHARPWHVLDDLDARLREDLALREGRDGLARVVPAGVERVGDGAILVHPTASIGRGVVLDASGGPIVIEARARIGHLAILVGPLWIGPQAVVIDRAHLKAGTSIGPVSKVGGEIGATIFQGFANKTHDGHLGDSWVGEWANFGAGTTNSNLLNTYGEVLMRSTPEGPVERTGRSAMGVLVGDHVKLAILTRIMTGASFGTGSMIAAAEPPRCVGRFRWLTERGDADYRLDRFLEVARTVMARRSVEPGRALLARLAALHARGSG